MKLKNELLPHQKLAVEKLIKLKVGALFMEQGTGKTITTLEIARIRFESGKINHVVWLCPCSAKGNIKREITRHCPNEMLDRFTICGIETLSSSIQTNLYLMDLVQRSKCFMVVDESLLIKNPKAYRTERITALSQECTYRIILNGTPVSRNEADLFAQFFLLDWRILGYKSYWSFAANHLEYDQYGQLRRVLKTDVLAEKIEPYTFQVTKKECLELPDKHYYTEYFCLTDGQQEEYYNVSERLLYEVDEFKPETIYRLFAGLQAVISGKRLQFNTVGNHFETFEFFDNPLDNPRIGLLLDMLAGNDEKAIIFCHYESEISQLCSLLPDAARFDGKMSHKTREYSLKQFAGDKKYLVANRNCAGYSLNLQFCHNIIYMSNDWDLGTRLQSEDRIHRIGQSVDVTITDICAQDTIDVKILDCLHRKESLLDSLKLDIKNCVGIKNKLQKIIYGYEGGDKNRKSIS